MENWLKLLNTVVQNSNNATKMFDDSDIQETCSNMADNLKEGFTDMTPEKRATVMITTLNILIRIYAFDKFNTITSHAKFRDLIQNCIEQIDKEIESNQPSSYSEYATGMVNLLLMNFARKNLIGKYLEQLLPKKSAPITGNILCLL
jgi:hypothetical protein